jgi:Protein of unknown function (DUF2804)
VRHTVVPYRGAFGAARPSALASLALPPAAMPSRHALRPLKAWRYVGVYGPELMLCIGSVRVGPARQTFWALWDRVAGHLHERTAIGGGAVSLGSGFARVVDRRVTIELRLAETAGVEAIGPAGASYAWTRKQGGVRATGSVEIDGTWRRVDARAVIDDTAAYYPRHTHWHWSAGVGRTEDAREVAWNLVAGVNDSPSGSERTVWVDDRPQEVGQCAFAQDLRGVDRLEFEPEATRERRDNLLVIRSSYRQPFGSFRGELPGGLRLAEGYGVMEEHEAWW